MSDGKNGSKKRTVQIVVISVLVLVSLVVVALSMTNVLVMKPNNLSDVAWRAGRMARAHPNAKRRPRPEGRGRCALLSWLIVNATLSPR